jgi:hypothetical protein
MNKHQQLIYYSTLVVIIILISTLAGFSLYLRWKEDSFSSLYRSEIYKLTADIFKEEIEITGMDVDYEQNNTEHKSVKMPILKGTVRNNSAKTVTSMTIEVTFLDDNGSVVYRDWVYPLGEDLAE